MNAPDGLGWGPRLDDGDLVIGTDGRLELVSGTAQLAQSLTLRLLTPYGSDRFGTSYGLDVGEALGGPHGRRVTRELLRLRLVRALTGDPRVREVREVLFDGEPGRAVTVEVVVETVRSTAVSVFVETGR
ncbi:hypothetical protein JNUCC64_30635 [Streptomyces sp. JNUCC 64]